jgi:hypothetical protein
LREICDARQLSEKIDAHLENVIPFIAGDLLKIVMSDEGIQLPARNISIVSLTATS